MAQPLTAEQWNDVHPVGTPVIAYPLLRPEYAAEIGATAKTLITRTRSVAWTLGDGEPVVLVDGYVGGISLEHIDPAPAAEIVHAGTDTAHALVHAATEETTR
ncbi:hypothetical protein [Kitasatospora sp. A2-31]|uniref:hypothetical protein n=1 Tax=Kitasatospora sp. A2-31 TaxID=2916414 RepID=UPI001EE882E8|nr:hypothetical protein [Kitasatospora sp. A2-31]MCG6493399.1 hypothetical protein [Kitasatospora sp. A2-31]